MAGPDPQVAAQGRWPVTAVFFLNGLTLASYLARLPSLKAAFGFSDGELGLIGVMFAAAALVAMQFVGRLVARYGSARVIRLGLLVMPLTLAGMGLAGSPLAFAVATALLGAVHGMLDVAMNAHAVAVERLLRRPILSGCHAAWSVSVVVASLVGAVLLRAGLTAVGWHLVGVAGVVIAAGAVLGPVLDQGFRGLAAGEPVAPERRRVSWRDGWSKSLVALGLTGTVLMICEGAALAWSGVYLHDSRGATLAVAALAVTAFTACQTAGRLIGDRLRLAYGDRTLFRAGGLLGAGGLVLAVYSPRPELAIAGFAVLGLGTSVLIPLTVGAVGHAGEAGAAAAAMLSRFTTFTYAGILLGPALIGWVAQAIGLRWTLAGLIPLLAGVALGNRLPTPAAQLDAARGTLATG